MPKFIREPTRIQAAGNKVKIISEFIGYVNTKDSAVSVALMNSPSGWKEPGQTPEFDEYSIVLKGMLHVKCAESEYDVEAGQAIKVNRNEWVQYSTPFPEGAQYLSVCLPAFTPEIVHRDE